MKYKIPQTFLYSNPRANFRLKEPYLGKKHHRNR